MAQPVVQQRIPELQTYIPKTLGDPDYVNPAQVYYAVDHLDWEEPRKVPVTGIVTEEGDLLVSRVVGKLTGLASRSVTVIFENALIADDIIDRVEVFRYVEITGKGFVKEPVLHYFASTNWVTNSGFALTIDIDEPLTGVIISFEFISIIEA